jgi:aminopeptidase N
VIYAGETHTNYGNHLLQLQILQALHTRDIPLIIGLEMFPRSSQQALDDYTRGKINEPEFIKASTYFDVWGYDYRLYRDILQYARAHQIPLIALNLDKKITSRVFAEGATDGLTAEQQSQIAGERDLDLPGYRQRLAAVYGQHDSPHGSGFSGFLQAQALWDETMAESVVLALQQYPAHRMLVLAGNGHVVKDSGIPPRVARRIPKKIVQRVIAASDNGEYSEAQVDYLMFAQSIELTSAGKLGVMLKEEGGPDEPGRVRIIGISPHGLAGKAGLKEHDRILTIEGTPVACIADIRITLLDKKAGDTVQVSIQRDRKKLNIPVELSGMPTGMGLPMGHPKQ